jgi:glycerol-3-phosphate acyltransferase PlsY
MLRSSLTALGSYLIGAVPVAYLTGRLLKGIDIREYGSGNAGPSNVWRHVWKPAVVPVGLAEIAQGAIGPLVAQQTGQSAAAQSIAGLAALIGHNWSPFLGFTGGRGIAHAIGYMLAVSRPALAAFAALALLGVALRKVPQLVLLGVLSMPLAALVARQPREIVAGNAAIGATIIAKRLLANDNSLPIGRVLLYRLLYDRDTKEREIWVERAREAVEALG